MECAWVGCKELALRCDMCISVYCDMIEAKCRSKPKIDTSRPAHTSYERFAFFKVCSWNNIRTLTNCVLARPWACSWVVTWKAWASKTHTHTQDSAAQASEA